jgi:hypothetical protein
VLFQSNYSRVDKEEIDTADGERLIVIDRGIVGSGRSKREGWVYLQDPQKDWVSIRDMMIRGMWPRHGVGLLTSLPGGQRLKTVETADSVMAELLASRAQYMIVGAYDGDALIFVDFTQKR